MKILMTGGCGFIGQHLTAELQLHGHEVTTVDIEGPDGGDNYRLDLRIPGAMNLPMQADPPDVVVHLAAQVGRIRGEDDVAHTIRANAAMTALVARAAAEHDARVVYASSSEVYGDQGDLMLQENMPCVLPHNLYGLSKRWGEEALQLYAPLGLKIVRLSMPYGPGAPPGRGRRAMDNMIWHAIHRRPIVVHRRSMRSWCHVSDTVRGIRLVLEQDQPGTWNVGRDDAEVSMLEIAYRACDLASAPYELIEEVVPPAAQTVVKRLSTHRLRRLGWQPTVDLDEGIRGVYEWIRHFDADGRYHEDILAA